jgi:lysophospholipase L1-like esterase
VCNSNEAFLRNIALVILATLVCLALVEVGLRLFQVVPAEIPRPVFYSNLLGDFEPNLSTSETLSGALRYNITTNSQGLRGRQEFAQQKPANTLRVLCIGDSFTYGTGVDDQFTYPALLRIYLEEKFKGYNIEVINAGVFLYDIVDEYDYYKDKLRKLGADVVVVQFYTNDLEGMTRWFFRPFNKRNASYSSLESAFRRLAIFNMAAKIRYKMHKGMDVPLPSGERSGIQYDQFKVSGDDATVKMLFDQHMLLDEKNYCILKNYWDMYLNVLREFKKTVEEDKGHFLFLMVPDEEQIKRYENAQSYAFMESLQREGVHHIDMLPVLRRLTQKNNKTYYNSPYDFHLNKEGYTLVAQAVANAIERSPDSDVNPFYVATKDRYRTYRNGVDARLRIGEDGSLNMTKDSGINSARVQGINLDTRCAQILGRTVCSVSPDASRGTEGALELKLEYSEPMGALTIFTPRKIGLPGSGAVGVFYSLDGGEEIEVSRYVNLDKTVPDAFDEVEFVEVDLPKASKKISVIYRVQGDATVFMKDDDQDYRQVKVIAYPAVQ